MKESRLQWKKLHKALQGRREYLKLLHRNHVSMFTNDVRVILMPTAEQEVNQWGLKLMGEYLLRQAAEKALLVTVDETVLRYAKPYYHMLLDVVVCDQEQMDRLLALYQMHPFDKRMVAVALDLPAGRNASRLLGVKGTDIEDLVAVGIYGMIPYRKGERSGGVTPVENTRAQARRMRKQEEVLSVKLVDFLLRLTLVAPFGIGLCLFTLIIHHGGRRELIRIRKSGCKSSGNEKNLPICICPYQGTGDVYLALGFLKDYARNRKWTDVRLCVIGEANRKICRLFGWDKVEVLKKRKMNSLVRYLVFTGRTEGERKLLHHDAMTVTTGIMDRMRNINGLNFYDLFAAGAFEQRERKPFPHPEFSCNEQELDKIFQENGLAAGKTVVLAPYSYTLQLLPDWVWTKIAERLQEMGYCVCTNCGGGEEYPVEGTKEIFFPFSLAGPFLEKAGYFVGIRSGLCDIISSAKCRKIIIYQGNLFWGDGTCMDYFSLNRMRLCEDAVELQYEGLDFYGVIDEVLAQFEPDCKNEEQFD